MRCAAVTEEQVRYTELPCDRKWKSTVVVKGSDDHSDRVLTGIMELLPGVEETHVTSPNKSADSNNNSRTYIDSGADIATGEQLLCRTPASGDRIFATGSGGVAQPCGLVARRQTTKPAKRRNATVREVAVCRRTEVVYAVATSGDTTGSDRSAYSGIYERNLDEILESVSGVECHLRRRRRRRAFRSSDKFYFRFPRTPEVQCYRSSSDSYYGCSDSDTDPDRKWSSSEDELYADQHPTAAWQDGGSFYRRLNRFRLSGSWGPEMTVIEP